MICHKIVSEHEDINKLKHLDYTFVSFNFNKIDNFLLHRESKSIHSLIKFRNISYKKFSSWLGMNPLEHDL